MYFILRNSTNKMNFDVVFVPIKKGDLMYLKKDIDYDSAVGIIDVLNDESLIGEQSK
jgi:hypothetical protein